MKRAIDFGWYTNRDGRRYLLSWCDGRLMFDGEVIAVCSEQEARRRLDGWVQHCDSAAGLIWLAGRLEGLR